MVGRVLVSAPINVHPFSVELDYKTELETHVKNMERTTFFIFIVESSGPI